MKGEARSGTGKEGARLSRLGRLEGWMVIGELAVLPYIASDLPDFDFRVHGVTTVHPGRTFWDKIGN